MLTFREANVSDAPLIAELVQAAFAEHVQVLALTPETCPNYVAFETAEQVLMRMNRGDLALLGCLGDRIAGTIRYSVDAADARMGHIKRLAVLPEYRGKGFGRELLVQAEDRLRSLGATVIELSVAAPLEPIQEFYKRAGYTPFEKRRVPTLPFEIMFMRKQVTPLTPGGSQ